MTQEMNQPNQESQWVLANQKPSGCLPCLVIHLLLRNSVWDKRGIFIDWPVMTNRTNPIKATARFKQAKRP